MMNISKITISFTIAIALSFGSLAYAGSSDRTTSTFVGAAVGGVAGNQLARHNPDKKAEKAAERHRATYQPYDKHNSRAYKASRKLNKKCHTKGNRDRHYRLAASKPENNFAGM